MRARPPSRWPRSSARQRLFARGRTRNDAAEAQLPLEYVRREDWIRFSSTLDAKLDAMRSELRTEITELKERIAERIDTL